MKILWLCNIILPSIASKLNLKPSNKEGWLSGICDAVRERNDFELAISFPVPKQLDGFYCKEDGIEYFGFFEDTVHPEIYDAGYEESLKRILDKANPDMVHVFGTEYPHTLAMCRCMKDKPEKILIGIQGILDIYKDHYFDGLPNYVVNRTTFRDVIKHDGLKNQQRKYALRAKNEVEAVKIAGNITGRTPFDRTFSENVNPNAKYHFMNETLRNDFYEGEWDFGSCERHSVFLSQGNYPIKGLHVMLEATSLLKEKYPDMKIYVAGDRITSQKTLKDKVKISSYGKYILELIKKFDLKDRIIFLGSLTADEIKSRLLKSNLFVCPSSIENSPNSLGEAMLLKVPCISSRVGGVPGIFEENKDGFLFTNCDSKGLADCIIRLWSDEEEMLKMAESAQKHAMKTHDAGMNYQRLIEIYREITKVRV